MPGSVAKGVSISAFKHTSLTVIKVCGGGGGREEGRKAVLLIGTIYFNAELCKTSFHV